MTMPEHKSDLPINIYDYNGTFTENAPLSERSWFRCGGKADLLFEPQDIDDLAHFLKTYPKSEPLLVLGGMANTIIRDGGIRGCVIMLGKPFADIEIEGNRIMAGAGALNGSVASAAAKAGIGGLEFLSGIPGTVGGALRMNAGAYGTEVKDRLIAAVALDRDGNFTPLDPENMDMRYRYCGVPENMTFVSAVFEGEQEDTAEVKKRLKDIKATRQSTQPISEKTGGSTFANPSDEDLKSANLPEGTRAWQIVEKVGGRDLKIGGARMSDKHLNFMINAGEASAKDLEDLGDELIKRAQDQLGLTLYWEIKRVGER